VLPSVAPGESAAGALGGGACVVAQATAARVSGKSANGTRRTSERRVVASDMVGKDGSIGRVAHASHGIER
jgi:hypothetical protein